MVVLSQTFNVETIGTRFDQGRIGVKLKAIIFDLDGTLGDTLPVCIAASRHAFERFLGRRFTDEEIIATFGPTEDGAIQRLIPDRWQAALQAYLEEYERGHGQCAAPFAGIEDALRVLKSRQVRLAIVTGKGAGSAEISMKYLGLARYFDVVETGSADGPIKPRAIEKVLATWDIAPEDAAYVGDTAYDMMAAAEVGVVALGAGWARSSTLGASGPLSAHVIFNSVDDFISWIGDKT